MKVLLSSGLNTQVYVTPYMSHHSALGEILKQGWVPAISYVTCRISIGIRRDKIEGTTLIHVRYKFNMNILYIVVVVGRLLFFQRFCNYIDSSKVKIFAAAFIVHYDLMKYKTQGFRVELQVPGG